MKNNNCELNNLIYEGQKCDCCNCVVEELYEAKFVDEDEIIKVCSSCISSKPYIK